MPRRGPVLLISNHQSFLDPVILGVAGHRRPCHSMARATLFRSRMFGWLLRTLRAIPIERGASDLAAMRVCLNVLRKGGALVVYPEGSRTADGATAAFAPGTMVLIKHARPIVVPVAIEGAHTVWPRNRKLPYAAGRVAAMYGRPVDPDKLIEMGAHRALRHLRDQVESMRLTLARRLS